MARRNLADHVEVLTAIDPLSQTDNTAYVSDIIDMQSYSSCMFAIAIGVLADADATATVLLEEGDNSALSDAAAVADADMIGTEATAAFQFDDDNEVRTLGYAGSKRYCRLTITPANNTGAFIISAVAVCEKLLKT